MSTDEFDQASNLARPDVFRLNLGVGKANFERLTATVSEPDYAALDQLLPHPVYAPQHWVSILNPSHATFKELALPLLTEAHDKLAARRPRSRDGEAED